MYLPRQFTLPVAPLSLIPLIAVIGLMTGCQPQTVATNAGSAIIKTAADDSAPDLVVTETVSQANSGTVPDSSEDVADSAPVTDDNSSTIVASAPLQSADIQSPATQTPESQSQDTKSQDTQSQGTQSQDIQPEIVTPPPPPEFKPHTVLSKPYTVLLSLLGSADIIRTEGQVKIWQYRLDRCVFDFFLTPENSQNSDSRYMVRDWAYRATAIGVSANEVICRRALANDRIMPKSG